MSVPALTPEEVAELKRALLKKGSEINAKLVDIMNGKKVSFESLFRSKPGETLEERLRRFLGLVDAQIQRVRAGTYGTCQSCGANLPVRELREVPWIDTCQSCAAKAAATQP